MSLLREIQDAAVDNGTDITVLLRKCLILAVRLKNESFKKWIEWELNGYPSKEELPAYRILGVTAYGNLAGGFGASMSNVPIPPGCLPEKYRESARVHYDLSPISASAQLLRNPEGHGTFQTSWPGDLIARVSRNIYKGYTLIAAWNQVPRGAIEAEIDSVRNRILALALEMESEAPDAGEAQAAPDQLSQERITQMFTTNIYGNVGNVASGNRDVTQSASVEVRQGDVESLRCYLAAQGVEEHHLSELESAIEGDGPKPSGIGQHVSGWMGKMIGEAGKGTWKVATTVAAAVLARAIAAYYGLPS